MNATLSGWRTIGAACFGFAVLGASAAEAKVPSAAQQMAGAVLAAPSEWRATATVLAYKADGTLYTARKGKGDMICLADDPKEKGFQSACYHRELEPYMARGRKLRAQGVTGADNRNQRWKEIDAKKLKMPSQPRALYVLHGKSFDAQKNEVQQPYLRWVIFTPYATPETTGLSLAPAPGAPWLMFPGTAGAHIMINPPQPK